VPANATDVRGELREIDAFVPQSRVDTQFEDEGASMLYGRSGDEWDDLVEEGYRLLRLFAWEGRPHTYDGFSSALQGQSLKGFDLSKPDERNAVGLLLLKIAEIDKGPHPDFLLTAYIVHSADGLPGNGFFKLARTWEMEGAPAERASKEKKRDFHDLQVTAAHNHFKGLAKALITGQRSTLQLHCH
jgi:hypothetical protein